MKKKRLLWLDDVRDPFTGSWLENFAPGYYAGIDDIAWVKNFDEFVEYIATRGIPDLICFDHDLGEDVAKRRVSKGMSKRQARAKKRETKSGYDCAKWLVEHCMDQDLNLPYWSVQSANPVGKENIISILYNYSKHRKLKINGDEGIDILH